MPLGKIISAGIKVRDAYNASKRDPEIPVPGRASSSGPVLSAPSNRAKANMAADILNIPGRNVVRDALVKRKDMLDKL